MEFTNVKSNLSLDLITDCTTFNCNSCNKPFTIIDDVSDRCAELVSRWCVEFPLISPWAIASTEIFQVFLAWTACLKNWIYSFIHSCGLAYIFENNLLWHTYSSPSADGQMLIFSCWILWHKAQLVIPSMMVSHTGSDVFPNHDTITFMPHSWYKFCLQNAIFGFHQ